MSPWVKFVLPKIGQSLAGAFWPQAVQLVTQLGRRDDLSGAEKRAKVVEWLREEGWAAAGFVANLIVELAVAWCQAKGLIQLQEGP